MEKEVRVFERWLQLFVAELEYKERKGRISTEDLQREFLKLLEEEQP